MTTIDEAVQRFEKCSATEALAFLIPMECDIAGAEKALGIDLPPSYRRFLEKGQNSSITARDIVNENRSAREERGGFYLPEFLIVFFHDGMGNQYCFDTRFRDDDGEFPIVFWDHELSTQEKLAKITTTDKTFGRWLLRYADDLPQETKKAAGSIFIVGCLIALAILVFLATIGATSIVKWLRK